MPIYNPCLAEYKKCLLTFIFLTVVNNETRALGKKHNRPMKEIKNLHVGIFDLKINMVGVDGSNRIKSC